MSNKERLDVLLVEKNFFESRERAKRIIMEGKILVDEKKIDKPGSLVNRESKIRLIGDDIPFVSRGGLKLLKAIAEFNLNLNEKICADIGASTGGFTDCMLQHGAKKIYSIDVGYGQLAWKLRNDSRVINMERTNIRNVTHDMIEDEIDFITIDVSFISLEKVLSVAYELLRVEGEIVALIKPQFEAGREHIGKKGVVRDKTIHFDIIKKIISIAQNLKFKIKNISYSPIKGPEGNIEYLIHLNKIDCEKIFDDETIKSMINKAHEELNK